MTSLLCIIVGVTLICLCAAQPISNDPRAVLVPFAGNSCSESGVLTLIPGTSNFQLLSPFSSLPLEPGFRITKCNGASFLFTYPPSLGIFLQLESSNLTYSRLASLGVRGFNWLPSYSRTPILTARPDEGDNYLYVVKKVETMKHDNEVMKKTEPVRQSENVALYGIDLITGGQKLIVNQLPNPATHTIRPSSNLLVSVEPPASTSDPFVGVSARDLRTGKLICILSINFKGWLEKGALLDGPLVHEANSSTYLSFIFVIGTQYTIVDAVDLTTCNPIQSIRFNLGVNSTTHRISGASISPSPHQDLIVVYENLSISFISVYELKMGSLKTQWKSIPFSRLGNPQGLYDRQSP